MGTKIADLMNANLLEVFGERDPDRRREAIARTYTDDLVLHDPEGTLTGPAALAAKVQALLDGAPGFVFRPAGPVLESQDLGLLAWEFGPEGQPAVVSGVDIALIRDGSISTVHTMLTASPGS